MLPRGWETFIPNLADVQLRNCPQEGSPTVRALKGPGMGKGFNQHNSDLCLRCQPREHGAHGLLGTARS